MTNWIRTIFCLGLLLVLTGCLTSKELSKELRDSEGAFQQVLREQMRDAHTRQTLEQTSDEFNVLLDGDDRGSTLETSIDTLVQRIRTAEAKNWPELAAPLRLHLARLYVFTGRETLANQIVEDIDPVHLESARDRALFSLWQEIGEAKGIMDSVPDPTGCNRLTAIMNEFLEKSAEDPLPKDKNLEIHTWLVTEAGLMGVAATECDITQTKVDGLVTNRTSFIQHLTATQRAIFASTFCDDAAPAELRSLVPAAKVNAVMNTYDRQLENTAVTTPSARGEMLDSNARCKLISPN